MILKSICVEVISVLLHCYYNSLKINCITIGESIYRKKGPNPQQIATKGFSTVFGSFRGQEQHTKNPRKSHNGKVVIFKVASKMAAMIC